MPATAADTDTDADKFRFAADWGPWVEHLTPAERRESILVLRTLASIICGRQHPLYTALFRAYAAADDAQGARGLALLEAAIEMERLEARPRRILLDSYAGNMLMEPPGRRGRPAGRYEKAEKSATARAEGPAPAGLGARENAA